MSGRELELWRERLLARYGDTTIPDRVGFALARTCDERGAVWISVRALRVRLVTLWPELLEKPKRGRHAAGISHDRLKRTLAAHPDWFTAGQVRFPNRRLGPALRLLVDSVRREIGLPVTLAEAHKWHAEMAPGEAAWLSHFPEKKWHDTSNPKTQQPKDSRESAKTTVLPAAADTAENGATMLDELIVAAAGRGLHDHEIVRVLLGYRDGETADETVTRMFPAVEQLEFVERDQGGGTP